MVPTTLVRVDMRHELSVVVSSSSSCSEQGRDDEFATLTPSTSTSSADRRGRLTFSTRVELEPRPSPAATGLPFGVSP